MEGERIELDAIVCDAIIDMIGVDPKIIINKFSGWNCDGVALESVGKTMFRSVSMVVKWRTGSPLLAFL